MCIKGCTCLAYKLLVYIFVVYLSTVFVLCMIVLLLYDGMILLLLAYNNLFLFGWFYWKILNSNAQYDCQSACQTCTVKMYNKTIKIVDWTYTYYTFTGLIKYLYHIDLLFILTKISDYYMCYSQGWKGAKRSTLSARETTIFFCLSLATLNYCSFIDLEGENQWNKFPPNYQPKGFIWGMLERSLRNQL